MPDIPDIVRGERIREIGRLVTKAMDDAQSQGYSSEEVLTATMFVCGATLSYNNIPFDPRRSVHEALPAFSSGYEFGKEKS